MQITIDKGEADDRNFYFISILDLFDQPRTFALHIEWNSTIAPNMAPEHYFTISDEKFEEVLYGPQLLPFTQDRSPLEFPEPRMDRDDPLLPIVCMLKFLYAEGQEPSTLTPTPE